MKKWYSVHAESVQDAWMFVVADGPEHAKQLAEENSGQFAVTGPPQLRITHAEYDETQNFFLRPAKVSVVDG